MEKSKRRPITFLHIILQNLKKRPLRTLLMIFFVFTLSFTLFSSSLILLSLKQGVDNTVERMGADIILVPEDYVSSLQDALFMGEPCTIYFGKEWLNKIRTIDGVNQISSQLFLATLSDSACCDNAIQIIAFDPATDFTIQPWIKTKLGGTLPDNQIVIGNNLSYEPGDTATYYGTEFLVAAKLQKTGMGYDNCVFLNYDTAYNLVKQPVVRNYFSIGDNENLISMVSVNVKEDYTIDAVAKSITATYKNDGIAVYKSNKLVKGLTENINKFSSYSKLLAGLLLIFTVLALMSIFTITIHERKREYGILRSLGAARIQLIQLIVGEAGFISLLGSILGSVIAFILVSVFHNYIIIKLKLPYIQPNLPVILTITACCILLSLFIGLITSLYAAIKISGTQAYLLIRENE